MCKPINRAVGVSDQAWRTGNAARRRLCLLSAAPEEHHFRRRVAALWYLAAAFHPLRVAALCFTAGAAKHLVALLSIISTGERHPLR